MMPRPFLIAIAGGSGSGKTLLARELSQALLPHPSQIVTQDAYYKTAPDGARTQVATHNFDHPDAIEWELLQTQLRDLQHGHTVEMPQYSYILHSRTGSVPFSPAEILIYEGTLILHDYRIATQMDLRIFLDVDADIRLSRRIERDLLERERSLEVILQQHRATVRPMYLEFVEPSQAHADLVLPDAPVSEWIEKILACLPEKRFGTKPTHR